MEGKFQSLYKNRLSSSFLAAGDSMPELKFLDESKDNRMIVISDGDIIKNIVRQDSSAYPLGFYPYTNQTFANKDFVLNCIQYLVDSEGLLAARNKEVKLRLLNTLRANDEKLKWQLVNVLFPILLIIGFGLGYRYWRRKRYATPAPPKQTTG
jgi:ABC-2 type transport system permease protein